MEKRDIIFLAIISFLMGFIFAVSINETIIKKVPAKTWVYAFHGDTIYMENNRGLTIDRQMYGHKMSSKDSNDIHHVECKPLNDTLKIYPLNK